MSKKYFSIFILVASLCSTPAIAETTGNQLYEWLGSTNFVANLQGYSYLEGVLDTEDFYLNDEVFFPMVEKNKDPTASRFKVAHICFGQARITNRQIKDIVFKYLENNPAKRHMQAHVLIRFALLEDFACANNPQSTSKK